MTTKKLIKPANGARVRDPEAADFAPIPAEGIEREPNAFWLRRREDGDVTIGPIAAKKGDN